MTPEEVITRDSLHDGWQEYRKTTTTRMKRIDGLFHVQTREGILTCPGGFLAIDSGGWPYPIAADEHARTYALASPAPPEAPPCPRCTAQLKAEAIRQGHSEEEAEGMARRLYAASLQSAAPPEAERPDGFPEPIKINRMIVCPKCHSDEWRTSWENLHAAKCDRCGHVWQWIIALPVSAAAAEPKERCARCKGNGRIEMLEHCPECDGSGYVTVPAAAAEPRAERPDEKRIVAWVIMAPDGRYEVSGGSCFERERPDWLGDGLLGDRDDHTDPAECEFYKVTASVPLPAIPGIQGSAESAPSAGQ